MEQAKSLKRGPVLEADGCVRLKQSEIML